MSEWDDERIVWPSPEQGPNLECAREGTIASLMEQLAAMTARAEAAEAAIAAHDRWARTPMHDDREPIVVSVRAQEQLAAMTTRAEAAEAELTAWQDRARLCRIDAESAEKMLAGYQRSLRIQTDQWHEALQRADAAEASAAAMREALESFRDANDYCRRCDGSWDEHEWFCPIGQALATDAGAALLAEVERLREFARAVRQADADSDLGLYAQHVAATVAALDQVEESWQRTPAIVFLDHLQEIDPDQGADRREKVLNNVEGAKQMARNLGCPVVLGVQAGRQCFDQAWKMPDLSAAQETSRVEQVADKLIALWLPAKTEPVGSPLGSTGWTVATDMLLLAVHKQRFGQTGGTIPLHVDFAANVISGMQMTTTRLE